MIRTLRFNTQKIPFFIFCIKFYKTIFIIISITEANQNFSKVARVVDEYGAAVILKNNVPRYLVIDFSKAEKEKIASAEDVYVISERLIKQNMQAYEVLAE